MVPARSPNKAPAATLMISAPGNENPVTATYRVKSKRALRHEFASYPATMLPCITFNRSKLNSCSRSRAK
jgi:hypothetical protein